MKIANHSVSHILSTHIPLIMPISHEAKLEVELLLAHVLNQPRLWLVTNPNYELTLSQYKKFQDLLHQRLEHRPLAYILGKKEFCGLNFYVDERVLVPRPETEFIVEYAAKYTITHPLQPTNWTIADIGTGSGCIAVTLAKQIAHAKLYATEVSSKALVVAKKNAQLHHVGKKIAFSHGSLLESLNTSLKIDILACNLPYIMHDRIAKLEPEVKDWEPKVALDGGDDGFGLYRKLFDQLRTRKYLPKLLMAEIDYSHTEIALSELLSRFPQANAHIEQDAQGLSRFLIATFDRN